MSLGKGKWRSRNKPASKEISLETVDESRVLVSDLRPAVEFKVIETQPLHENVSSIQKDVLLPSLNPNSDTDLDIRGETPKGWRGKLQTYLLSLRFHALVTILVLLDVFLVLLDLIITGNLLVGHCTDNSQCNASICSNDCVQKYDCLEKNGYMANNTNMVCKFVGFTRECVEIDASNVPIVVILNGVSLFILFVFILEITLKIIAFGLKFFKKFFEVFDAVIVFTSFIMEFVKIVFTIQQLTNPGLDNEDSIAKLQFFDLLIAFRLWRVVRIITGALASYNTAKTQSHKSEISKLMQNEKKRYKELYREYEYACNEVLRLRQLVIALKGSPFPPGYNITLLEIEDLNIHPDAYNLLERRDSSGRESIA